MIHHSAGAKATGRLAADATVIPSPTAKWMSKKL